MNINKNDAQGFLNLLNVLVSKGPGQFALACDETTTVLINVMPNGQMGVARVSTVIAVDPDAIIAVEPSDAPASAEGN